MCTHETGAYSTLPGDVIGVVVVLSLVKFGISASIQFVASFEDAQNLM